MNSRHYLMIVLSILLLFSFINSPIYAQLQDAPANIAAALVLKLASFDKGISGDFTIYVIDAPEVAKELEKGVGKTVQGATLSKVESGSTLPSAKPNLLYVGSDAKLQDALKYARENKVLTASAVADLTSKGVTLGIGVGDDGKPKIMLNLTASEEEGRDWNPAIMKVAKTIK
ncbi:YfiR family protein [candidate division KSB1 bacterium]|nr:YfiR family protein [candidate division KSB1 bacterium]